MRSRSSIGSANAAMWSASAGEGPISMPSASTLSSLPDRTIRPGLAGRRQRVARADRVLGLHIEDQLVEVGALLDAGGLDLVRHLEHRRVDGIDRDTADFSTRSLVLHGGNVATTTLDDELDLKLALVVQGRDAHIRVVHGHTGRRDDVTGGDRTRPACAGTW